MADSERRNGGNTATLAACWGLFVRGDFFLVLLMILIFFLIKRSSLVFGDAKRETNREGKIIYFRESKKLTSLSEQPRGGVGVDPPRLFLQTSGYLCAARTRVRGLEPLPKAQGPRIRRFLVVLSHPSPPWAPLLPQCVSSTHPKILQSPRCARTGHRSARGTVVRGTGTAWRCGIPSSPLRRVGGACEPPGRWNQGSGQGWEPGCG